MRNKKKSIVIGMIAVVTIMIATCFFYMVNSKEKKVAKLLDLGNKYLDELNYEQALATYNAVLELIPDNPDAYLGIVEVYIREGEYDTALEYAKKGYEVTQDIRLQEKIEMIESGNIYDSKGRSVKMTTLDGSGNVLWWHEYTYNKEGQQDSVTSYDEAGKQTGRVDLTYDQSQNAIVNYGLFTENGELTREENKYINNLLIESLTYDMEGELFNISRYKYNDKKEVIETVDTDENGNLNQIWTYEYDEKGNEIKANCYDENEKLYHYQIREYDEKENVFKYSDYNSEGKLNWYELYEYDENGNVISDKEYDGDGNFVQEYVNQ